MVRFAAPEDFRVDEIPLFAPSGRGDHTYVRVEKTGRTTEEVVRALAQVAGVRPRDVGYAGRKDRFAVTTQWFSVPRLDPDDIPVLALEGVRVLDASRHDHKLRTGQLAGNCFALVVRDVEPATARSAAARLEAIAEFGVVNRFGAQRFGRDGTNAELGRRVLDGELMPRDRRRARFFVSALQAAVFNDVLAVRRDAGRRLEAGDVAVVHESGGLFVVEDAALEQPRAERFEISATGPIFGTRVIAASGQPAERERKALAVRGVALERPLPRGLRLRGARRPFRVRPREVRSCVAAGSLHLGFILPAGSYASVLVEELLGSGANGVG
ncbi:MAG: tRNA pseudouridine(13) synthase TruD [Deltaproteobacteria bacterium]|nr:tRNA pseudouridine(13) synthase TruD [Deltaproteobacteria bacterium]